MRRNKKANSPTEPIPASARDAYQMARQRGTDVQEAYEWLREHWVYWGYNDYGQAAYVPPGTKI